MGVTIRPGGASWSYSGFNRFRRRLAAAEGIDLDQMAGFGGEQRPWESPNGTPVTVLEPFLNHSDCDGYLRGTDCASVFPRLAEILASWRDSSEPDLWYDIEQGRRLVDAMGHCAVHGCALVFQ